LQLAEIGRLGRDRPARPDAYDRAYSLLSEFTADSMAAASDCLDHSLAVDPAYAPAMPRRRTAAAVPFPGLGADRGKPPGTDASMVSGSMRAI